MSPSRVEVHETSSCDLEPIHIPGAVQSHGVLLVLSVPDLVVQQVSASSERILGLASETLLGHRFVQWLDDASLQALTLALSTPRREGPNPVRLDVAGRTLDGVCHRHLGTTILELEPVVPSEVALPGFLRTALESVQSCSTLPALQQVVVDEVRRMTGFDRVMIYRFDEQGHGSVVAEATRGDVPPYLGLHYPASDIPRQARALYLQNWLRIIPDARYVPSPISAQSERAAPLDLSHSILRSVSPVHLEYMANMGATASMSISLIVKEQLWGLISCVHHSGTRFLSYEGRAACEVIGRLTSLETAALEELARVEYRDARRATLDLLESSMRSSAGPALAALSKEASSLCELVAASGAAISGAGALLGLGAHPDLELLGDLIAWLDQTQGASLFATTCLSELYPPADAWKGSASGLLTFTLPGKGGRRLLWFRPEIVQTIRWGGDPHKGVEDDASGALRPRRSFELWKEQVSSTSLLWAKGELETATELRRRAVEIDLERQVELGEQAVRARDDLVAVVSHDLKTPLSVIQMQTSVLLRGVGSEEGESSRRLRAASERIQRAVDRMNTLIHDLLDLSKIEAGRFAVQVIELEVRAMVEDALVLLESLGHKKAVTLVLEPGIECTAMADRDRIFQVLSNLISNALRFSPDGGVIHTSVGEANGEVVFTVKDQGPGIAAEQLPHLFNRYWQAPRTDRRGSGLGLYIAKGIVEAHEGRIWVNSTLGSGSAFSFALPAH
jgi:chemotaxis family two-component system sensor kinase Cph1